MSQKSYDNTPSVYLIPTPIGNMDDITLRAINILKQVEVIFSEDTRVTGLLLQHLNIKKKLISSHNYNETNNIVKMFKYLEDGHDVGIVTDRGTPIISDPGYGLAKAAIDNGYNVIGLPGPTALISALITSGLSPLPFTFYGFLNSRSSKRRKELEKLKNLLPTMIFYESPKRLLDTLSDMKDILGNRKISISREISKRYEEIYRGNIENVIFELVEPRGEFVIVVDGSTEEIKEDGESIVEHVNSLIESGLSSKDAIREVAKIRNLNKNEVYQKFLRGE